MPVQIERALTAHTCSSPGCAFLRRSFPNLPSVALRSMIIGSVGQRWR